MFVGDKRAFMCLSCAKKGQVVKQRAIELCENKAGGAYDPNDTVDFLRPDGQVMQLPAWTAYVDDAKAQLRAEGVLKADND